MSEGPRYQAHPMSMLGHGCCFDASVVDTETMADIGGFVICECNDMETAERIALALNRSAMM